MSKGGHANWWKALAAGLAAVAGMCATPGACGAEIRDVTARQRYPWNGLVDIRCTVEGIEKGVAWPLSLAAVDPETGDLRDLSHFWVVRDGTNSVDRVAYANGELELLWDAGADLGEVVCSNMVVKVDFGAHPMTQLWEGGPYWADRNVGAEEPWGYGLYFWWGDVIGYIWENDQWVASDGSASGFVFANAPNFGLSRQRLLEQGWTTTNGVLAPKYDVAQVHWGGEWRMPTEAELRGLVDNCDRTWVTTNGIKGHVVRGRDDYEGASIFLPAAGWGNNELWEKGENWGHYWASDPCIERDCQSWRLNFTYRSFYMDYHYDRHDGVPCRPVRGGFE